MPNVNVFLRENLAQASKNLYTAPDIPESKLNNAVKAFNFVGSPATVIALFDNTLFGSAKEGILFTGEQIVLNVNSYKKVKVPLSSISSVEHIETVSGSKGDKIENSLLIRLQDESTLTLKYLLSCDYGKLAEILNTCTQKYTEFKEERQLIPIDELKEELKEAYVKIIINAAYADDEKIDKQELAEILVLMTRLNLSHETRLSLRSYMSLTQGKHIPLGTLLESIAQHSPDGQLKALHISLVKDLINLHYSGVEPQEPAMPDAISNIVDSKLLGATGVVGALATTALKRQYKSTLKDSDIKDFKYFQDNKALLNVNEKEIDLIVDTIKNDYSILKDDITDDQIASTIKQLSAKAAAVGTPLAAVYLSGSVIGMSAAGLTSGLASLGMGGILGMSGMVTGIGVAVLLGVGAYSGVRKLTGASELSRFKQRELMLYEIIKLTQNTISLVMQDINTITTKLNEAIKNHGALSTEVTALANQLSEMASAGNVLTDKANTVQSSVNKIKCPKFLNENKLRSLTREPTKAELYDYIVGFYDEKQVKVKKESGEVLEETKLCIQLNHKAEDYAKLGKAFEAIGYFNAGEVVAGMASDVAAKARKTLGGVFS